MENKRLFIILGILFLFSTLLIGIVNAACPSGMVGYWSFDETSGNTASDSIGNNDGTLINGPIWTTGQVNGALNFDGVNDYVNCGNDPSLNLAGKNITVSAWFLAKGFPVGGHPDYFDRIVNKDDDATDGFYGLGIRKLTAGDTPHLTFKTRSNGVSYNAGSSTTTPVVANKWYHVVGVNNGISNLIYVNGVFKHSIASDVIGGSVTDSLTIGYHYYPKDPIYPYYFNGLIDEVAIYNRALTPQEIENYYNNGLAGRGYCYQDIGLRVFDGTQTVSIVNAVGLNWYTPSGKNFFVKTCSDSRTNDSDGIDIKCSDTRIHCLEEGDYWVEFDMSEEGASVKDCRAYPDPYKCGITGDGYGKLIVKAWNVNWDLKQGDCECYGKTWLPKASGPGEGNCCGDDGALDDYCTSGYKSCLDGNYYADGDSNEYTCSCGGGYWALGGDSSATTCCEDNNEYRLYRKGQIIDSNDDACCNSNTDCVWDSNCFESGNTPYDLNGERRHCTNGEWGPILELKCNQDNLACDYCDDTNMQCFVSANNCVNSGTFILDNFCENGKWTTRTKLVALQLLDIAEKTSPSDYSLFCDDYEKTLNYYGYKVFGVPVIQHLTEVNDICVLKMPNQVIFGATLNKPINEGRFIDALSGVNNCNDAINKNDGNFHQCNSGSSKAWYNAETQSVIYSNNNIYNLPSHFELNTWGAFLTFLRNPFQSIFNFLFNLFKQKSISVKDYDFINYTKEFSRIYLNRKDIKSIKGITEEIKEPKRGEYISITYSGYNEDICSTVNLVYDKFKREGQLGRKDLVLCHYDPATRNYYVVSNSSMALALWPELTAILRP